MAWRAWCRARRGRCGRGCRPAPAMGSMHCRRSITHPGSSRRRRSIMVRTSAISSDNASMTATGRISDSAGSLMVVWQDARFGEVRSEEHTSELQSLMRISYAVFCLKKKLIKQKKKYAHTHTQTYQKL